MVWLFIIQTGCILILYMTKRRNITHMAPVIVNITRVVMDRFRGASHFLFVHPRFLSLLPFLASQLHPL